MIANKNEKVAVRLRGVTKGFGEGSARIHALTGVHLDAYLGEMLMLVGPSGCGKTTLLSLIAGLLDTDGGSVSAFGSSLEKMNSEQKVCFRRDNVGFVFQQFNLIPVLNAVENVSVPLLIRDIPRKQATEQAQEMLDMVGLGHRLKFLPTKLSGGEQQRVAIARALVAQPRLLICDEPTASLDGDTGAKIMQIIRDVACIEKRCVIVVTHDSRIFKYGDRIAKMSDGRVLDVQRKGTEVPDEVLSFNNP
jgi:putative ABC transport system ATP-binding protein